MDGTYCCELLCCGENYSVAGIFSKSSLQQIINKEPGIRRALCLIVINDVKNLYSWV